MSTTTNPSSLFIHRPVATGLMMVALLLAGLLGWHFLPRAALPQVDTPTIEVTTLYPGAGPEVMATAVSAPLERQFGQMPGLDAMTAISAAGSNVITLRFTLDTPLSTGEQEVQAAINAASTLLPSDLPAPPIYAKVNPADAPVVTLALTAGPNTRLTDVREFAETRLAQKLSQVSGVGLVTIAGGQRPAVRVSVDTHKLAAAGLTLDDVRTAIASGNVNSPKGTFDGPFRAVTLDANDRLDTPAEYRNLILATSVGGVTRSNGSAASASPAISTTTSTTNGTGLTSTGTSASGITGIGTTSSSGGNGAGTGIGLGSGTGTSGASSLSQTVSSTGTTTTTAGTTTSATSTTSAVTSNNNTSMVSGGGAVLRLGDVATIDEAAEDSRQAAWAQGKPALLLDVRRQPGANVMAVVDAINVLREQIKPILPAGVELTVIADRTVTIRASVESTLHELILAVVLVVLVIFLFLRSLPATFIPALAAPISLIGTLAAMWGLGYSVNNLTLMALTVATGFVVDDAIVMIENIARHIENGEAPFLAAIRGSGEIAFTILSLTISLVAVLIPLLFMGDVVGRLFREFAVTLAVAICISAFISLTLTPMLCARLLKSEADREERQGRFTGWLEEKFKQVEDAYARSLDRVLGHQLLVLLIAVATFALTALLYIGIPKGFFPVQDTGIVSIITTSQQGTSFAAMNRHSEELAEALGADPAVAGVSTAVGADGINSTVTEGRLNISLKPHDQRDALDVVMPRLVRRAAQITGITASFQPVQDLTLDDRPGQASYRFVLQGPDSIELNQFTADLVAKLKASPLIAGAVSEGGDVAPRAFVHINRDAAGRLGITPQQITDALYSAFGQRPVSTIFTQSTQYRVILDAQGKGSQGLQSFDNVYIPSAGGPVRLGTVATVTPAQGAASIIRESQYPATIVYFEPAAGASLGKTVEAVQNIASNMNMPQDIELSFEGAAALSRGVSAPHRFSTGERECSRQPVAASSLAALSSSAPSSTRACSP